MGVQDFQTLENIRPQPNAEHIEMHSKNGDFSRWGKLGAKARQAAKSVAKAGKVCKVLGVAGVALQIFDIIGAEDQANKNGISVWKQMEYEIMGYSEDEIKEYYDLSKI
jgi:hypothetical protein